MHEVRETVLEIWIDGVALGRREGGRADHVRGRKSGADEQIGEVMLTIGMGGVDDRHPR